VNIVTPSVFKQYPTPWDMAKSNPQEIYTYISSISYPNNKANNLHKMSQMLTERFDGIVPNNIEMLQELPGVGRKTANVVSAVAFNQPAMPVDTHVFRVSNRLGLTNNAKTPFECEKILVKNIPQTILSKAHHWLLLHGRYTCTARKPQCEQCGLIPYCKSAKKRTK
jgi:endonuclease-3